MFAKECKYIVIEHVSDLPTPILFSDLIQHKDIAKVGGKVISAGFCKIHAGPGATVSIDCYSESVSLRVKSRGKEDEELILQMLHKPW